MNHDPNRFNAINLTGPRHEIVDDNIAISAGLTRLVYENLPLGLIGTIAIAAILAHAMAVRAATSYAVGWLLG